MNQTKPKSNHQLFHPNLLEDSGNFNHMNVSNNLFSIKNEAFKFFRKQIKLRNVIQRELWNRTRLLTNNTYTIQAKDQISTVTISAKVEQSIANYLFNNPNSDFIGRLYQSTMGSHYDKIEPSEDNNNLILNSLPFEEEKINDSIYKVLNQLYSKITHLKMPMQTLFVFKKKEDRVIRKIWAIYPNVNFELNQIKNMSFSNTQLNKCLKSKSKTMEEYKNGLLTLSKESRLIALTEKNQKKNQVIIGIWLNFKEEQPNNNQIELSQMLMKYQSVIYQKCYEFVNNSSTIESVFSPNIEEGIFLLVIFYQGLECQYEIKITPNSNCFNEDKLKSNSNSIIREKKWLIAKFNSVIDLGFTYNAYNLDMRNSFPVKSLYLHEFMDKKFIINNQISVLTKSQVIQDRSCCNSTLILPGAHQDNNHINEKDKADEQLQELLTNTYLDIDSFDDLYNYPLIMPQQYKLNNNTQLTSSNLEPILRTSHLTSTTTQNKPNGEMLLSQPNRKHNEELYASQTSTNSHSNLILSLKKSNEKNTNTSNNNNNNNNINMLIQQTTQRILEQSNALKELNNHVSQVEAKAHLLLNRLLMSTKHSITDDKNNTNKDTSKNIKQTNTSIQVPHIRSVNLTALNEEED